MRESSIISVEYFGETAVIIRIETEGLMTDDAMRRFHDAVTEAIGPRSRIVFDMAHVRFLSSAAMAKFINLLRQSRTRKGQLVFCRLTPGVREAFQVNRLDRVFKIASSLEEAMAALSWSLELGCPIGRCEGTSLSHDPSIANRGGELCCRSCGCQFLVAPFQLAANGEAQVEVSRFAIPTYADELIRAELGVIVNLHIVGRLDLFASEAFVDAMRSLPQSCRALLDLRSATELSEPGLRLLEEHFRVDTSIDRVVVLVDPDRFHRARVILSNFRVTMIHDEAIAVLRGSGASDESPARLVVFARTVDITAG
ncbi:MAG TPA: STAS domain-containing protein [Chloroflexota bacterium]|nr:STAS domain-containing protein [Chloroflexota bacterium]